MPKKQALYYLLQEKKRRTEHETIDSLYPDDGPLRRELYPKHLAAFQAGKEHDQRYILGANRIGKTYSIGGYETALHLTGLYPDWWDGYVFDKPILVWTAGTKAVKTRDVNQLILLGPLVKTGSKTVASGGMIPAFRIGRPNRKSGVANAVDYVEIDHVNGYKNTIKFLSYEEGRQSFEAAAVDFAHMDEESPKEILDETLMRLLTTQGRMICTYTPIFGMSEATLSALQGTDLL